MFADRGALIVDADQLAREVVKQGTAGLRRIADHFGPEILTASGDLDRSALAQRVFADDDARLVLEQIVHPAVGAEFEARVAAALPGTVVVYDVPLLVENDLADAVDLVVVTHAEREERIRRAVTIRGMTPTQVSDRMAAQATDADRIAVADVVIRTDGDLEEVRSRVDQVWNELLLPELSRRQADGTP